MEKTISTAEANRKFSSTPVGSSGRPNLCGGQPWKASGANYAYFREWACEGEGDSPQAIAIPARN